MLALALSAFLAVAPVSPSVAPATDTTASRAPTVGLAAAVLRRDPVRVYPRLAPSAFYSPSRGFGIGVGIGVRNLLGDGSTLTADVRLQQREQGAAVALFTGDPYAAPVFGVVAAEGTTTNRRRYYGLGPFTDDADEVFLDHREAHAEVRLGLYPLGHTGLLLQPGVRLLYDRFADVDDASPVPLTRFDTPQTQASFQAVRSVEGVARYGLSAGLEVAVDLRDGWAYPRRGAFVSVEGRHFAALDGSRLATNRLALATEGYLPLGNRGTLIGRLHAVVTRGTDGDGDGAEDAIPFYYLPTLDGRLAVAFPEDRLRGRDVLVGEAGVRVPLFSVLGVYGVDGLVMGTLGNAYDDVVEQVRLAVALDPEAPPGATGRAPLRPALGLGLGLVNLDKQRVVIGGLVGLSPDGVTVATMRVAVDLRDARPLFR